MSVNVKPPLITKCQCRNSSVPPFIKEFCHSNEKPVLSFVRHVCGCRAAIPQVSTSFPLISVYEFLIPLFSEGGDGGVSGFGLGGGCKSRMSESREIASGVPTSEATAGVSGPERSPPCRPTPLRRRSRLARDAADRHKDGVTVCGAACRRTTEVDIGSFVR
ncbi:hypothetical protein EYF80_034019 [Liparis tanakae]|uniref:Uncharacterized protein n=1 Tax=Liparis tanakae TaxID=230148 RepID=A0A4Z2GR45_9TELE|nr:hypothetical protein EYF80_034019 [Liparis tanakae]